MPRELKKSLKINVLFARDLAFTRPILAGAGGCGSVDLRDRGSVFRSRRFTPRGESESRKRSGDRYKVGTDGVQKQAGAQRNNGLIPVLSGRCLKILPARRFTSRRGGGDASVEEVEPRPDTGGT